MQREIELRTKAERDLRRQEALEDFHALKALRSAKRDPKNQKGQPFEKVAQKLALL